MARLLATRFLRETSIMVDGKPLIVSVEPSGLLGFRLKNARMFVYMPLESALGALLVIMFMK